MPMGTKSIPERWWLALILAFLSDRYAADVARVFAANGFTTYLAQADAPTPAISYAIKHMNAIAGVVITASHNAPRYNGVKLKAAYGGSASPEQSSRVEVYLNTNEERRPRSQPDGYGKSPRSRLDPTVQSSPSLL